MAEIGGGDILKGARAAAEATGLKPRDIYYLVENEQVPYKKVGHLLYFSRERLISALRP